MTRFCQLMTIVQLRQKEKPFYRVVPLYRFNRFIVYYSLHFECCSLDNQIFLMFFFVLFFYLFYFVVFVFSFRILLFRYLNLQLFRFPYLIHFRLVRYFHFLPALLSVIHIVFDKVDVFVFVFVFHHFFFNSKYNFANLYFPYVFLVLEILENFCSC